MKSRQKQRGMSTSGVILLLTIGGFFATVLVKIGPAYMDNRVVAQMLQSLKEDYAGADIQEVTDRNIRGKVSKYFQVNMVGDEIMDAVEITRDGPDIYITVNYEVRRNIIGNVDLVVVFNNEVNIAE